MANPRDFEYPVACFEDKDVNGYKVVNKYQNCLHLATAKNRQDMVDYLLTSNSELASKPDSVNKETPIFYALSKHKS